MLLLIPALALMGLYLYYNGTAGINGIGGLAVVLMASYCLAYYWPPYGLQYSASKMGSVFYLLPLGSFGLLLWAADAEADKEQKWIGGVFGVLGMAMALACISFFKFHYWPQFS